MFVLCMKTVPGDAASGLPGSCLGLLLPCWTGTTAFLGLHLLFQTGLPPLHSPEGSKLAPGSIHWLRITVCSLGGLQGLLDQIRLLSCSYWHRALYMSSSCFLCCTPAALNSKKPPLCTTDFSDKLWCCNCTRPAAAAPVS